jgi:hypothetical protein
MDSAIGENAAANPACVNRPGQRRLAIDLHAHRAPLSWGFAILPSCRCRSAETGNDTGAPI